MVLPSRKKISLFRIPDQPLTYKYDLDETSDGSTEEDFKDADTRDEENEEEKEESKLDQHDNVDVHQPHALMLKRGDLIVSVDQDVKPVLNCSKRLIVELFLCPEASICKSLIVTKGFQFDICLHSHTGVATFDTINGRVKLDQSGNREFIKEVVKMAKSGDRIFGKLELD